MSTSGEFTVLNLLQPDLLTVEELKNYLQSRCRMDNLDSMSKEQLVRLFRQIILPFPQRIYRANRRGKMLTARRTKAGLDSSKRKESEDNAGVNNSLKVKTTSCGDRLKPPPDLSSSKKIRTSSSESHNNNRHDLDKIVINDRRKSTNEEGKKDISSSKIKLKRPPENASSQSSSGSSDIKKQRTMIKWP